MDPGWDPTAGFSGLIVIGAVNVIGALSNLVLIYTVFNIIIIINQSMHDVNKVLGKQWGK